MQRETDLNFQVNTIIWVQLRNIVLLLTISTNWVITYSQLISLSEFVQQEALYKNLQLTTLKKQEMQVFCSEKMFICAEILSLCTAPLSDPDTNFFQI